MQKMYETSDIIIASAIISVFGIHPEFLDRTNPSRIIFIFKKQRGFERFLEAYWKKELTVELTAFAAAQKFLKNQIYNR